jgi:hypothetical protein
MICGAKGTHGLAHQREITGQGTDGKDEGLDLGIPGLFRMSVTTLQERSQTAAASHLLASSQQDKRPGAGLKIIHQDTKLVENHGSTSSSSCLARISRQFCGQNATQRPQWMQTKTSPSLL